MNLTKAFQICLTGLALFAAPISRAFTYSDGDVLLIFRADGLHNVEFNLGNIGQFLNQTNGYTVAVTNWSFAVVTNNYALTNGNVQFLILATTSKTATNRAAWVTDSQPLIAANDVTSSGWANGLWTPINATGLGAVSDPSAPPNTNYDVLLPTVKYSFDYIASNGGTSSGSISYLGAGSGIAFKAAGVTPTTVLFYAIQPASTVPKPAATLVGSFTLNPQGSLVFQAGPLFDATQITSIAASGAAVSVTFNTKAAVKYRLLYSTQFQSPLSAWTILNNAVAGDGTPHTLLDPSATDTARFYAVESYP
jgi:hypothetical protein